MLQLRSYFKCQNHKVCLSFCFFHRYEYSLSCKCSLFFSLSCSNFILFIYGLVDTRTLITLPVYWTADSNIYLLILLLIGFPALRTTTHHPHCLICEYLFLLLREWRCICNGFNPQFCELCPLESEGTWQAPLELLLDFLLGKKQRFFHTYFTDQVWMMSKFTKKYEKCKKNKLNSRTHGNKFSSSCC